MAEISKIKVATGTYDIKDSKGREMQQVNPDNFKGTDSEKLQQAYERVHYGEDGKTWDGHGVITLTRKYVVDTPIYIAKNVSGTEYRGGLGVIFEGGEIELNAPFLFTSVDDNNYKFFPQMNKVRFTTSRDDNNLPYVYDCNRGLKPVATDCNFYRVNFAFAKNKTGMNYVQSGYLHNCEVSHNSDFILANQCFNVVISDCRFERTDNGTVCKLLNDNGDNSFYPVSSMQITNTLIEGYRFTTPLHFGSCKGLLIAGVYSEHCNGFVKFYADSMNVKQIEIKNCFVDTPAPAQIESDLNFIHFEDGSYTNTSSSININNNCGNWSGINLTNADARLDYVNVYSNKSTNGGSQSPFNKGALMQEWDVDNKNGLVQLYRGSTSLNDRYCQTGFWRVDATSNITHPSGSSGFVQIFKDSDEQWGLQIYHRINTTEMHERYLVGGVWGAWFRKQ